MDDPKLQTTEFEAGEPRSVGQAVGSLFEGATEALTRAANCNDPDWQKFHLGTAAVYKSRNAPFRPTSSVRTAVASRAMLSSTRGI
jgi:hypothetical protein